ncbi:PhzF family phenazine biosynthesis protein [Plebeiibacterium marinum]|uniref:PhzF family phenazine biosynthesis protein n=1 Tax=Plebeiibacterium marinum TaxID=2992111 RepID=A0AAE3MAR3_9BACT|nr:PhzF family phenazine biosynthesis protein [Plebeiobacterium marinum]MCW3804386.1 PhzF family phenazine biosynthesis protein [Plebeiobacterium marinum]
MTYPIYQIDAFTSILFKGNPAAVVLLDKWLPNERLQLIAMENNLSETAFICPQNAELHIRWFTPTTEVELCGHATLASAHVLFNHEEIEGDEITFHSQSGLLRVLKDDNKLTLDFPLDDFYKVNELPELMRMNIRTQVNEIYRGKTDYMFVFSNQKEIENFIPSLDIIAQLDSRGLIITAPGDEVDFVSRYFGPQTGIPEDPVTGSAHTTLTPFWSKRLGKQKMNARQISQRGGCLTCELRGSRVLIGGGCRTFFKGELYID